MSDLNLQLSQLIDDELGKDESTKLLEKVLKQPELATKLRHYQWVGSAIKTKEIIHTDVDFVNKINQSIKQEAVVFTPAWQHRKTSWKTLSAIAASVAIIGFGGIKLAPENLKTPFTIADNSKTFKPAKPQAMPVTVAVIADKTTTKLTAKSKVDPRFIEYLEAHDNSLYAAGSRGFQSYIRVVSLGQK